MTLLTLMQVVIMEASREGCAVKKKLMGCSLYESQQMNHV